MTVRLKQGLTLALGALSTLAGAPWAGAAPAPTRQPCFYASNINNYTVPNDRLVYIRVGAADVYRLDLMNDCIGLSFRQSIAFTRDDPSTTICSAIDLTIRFREVADREVCPVSEMRKLTPVEIAALPKRDRP